MLYLKEEKGITLVALIIMVIVIIILAGISLTQGSELLKTTKVETYVTNMITIRAKAKVYAEEVNAGTWDVQDKSSKRSELYSEKYNMTKPSNESELISKVDENVNKGNGVEFYQITKETLTKMGLEDLAKESNDGDYVVAYDAGDYTNLDIIYTKGIEYNGKKLYTLSSLQKETGE
jgi:Tfp pilus assembly protein PilE